MDIEIVKDRKDLNGVPCTLEHLCGTEPMWAVNRIRAVETTNQELNAKIARLTIRVSDLKMALGDGAGWFDRARAAEDRVQSLRDDVMRQKIESEAHRGVAEKALLSAAGLAGDVERLKDMLSRCEHALDYAQDLLGLLGTMRRSDVQDQYDEFLQIASEYWASNRIAPTTPEGKS